MPAITNSSPLILFGRIGRLELLRDLFGAVVAPQGVREEVTGAGTTLPGAAAVASARWITWVPSPGGSLAAQLQDELGRGESETIALAVQRGGRELVLLDDRAARRVARGLDLEVTGSAGLLLRAKEAGILQALRPLLTELRSAGLYLSEATFRLVLVEAGEAAG